MDGQTEVKKKRSRWVKSAIWLVGIVISLALAVLIAATIDSARTRRQAEALARLPVREQNLAVFDAAMALLKSNYFDPALFEKPEWGQFEAQWREKSAAYPGRGVWFYMNVLQNMSSSFPESHLYFQAPPGDASPPPGFETGAKPKPSATSAAKKVAATPAPDFATASPGFEAATIRRGQYQRQVVAEVLRGSPAERAGIAPGWALGDWSVLSNDGGIHYQATFFKLGPANARELERTGLPLATDSAQEIDAFVAAHTVRLAFDYEKVPSRTEFETYKLPNGATYLRFDHFNDWGLVSRALDAIDGAGPKGLVLDLRRNTGGLMLHMMRVNGRLLGDGAILGTLRSRGRSQLMHAMKFGAGHFEGPLVVLVGPATASAAEITAAAVQHHKRGLVIGRTTNGSVVSAQKYALPDGGTIAIPVNDFLRPDRRRIEGVGVEPQLWILPTLEDVRAGRDPALERALIELR